MQYFLERADHQPRVGVRTQARLPLRVRARCTFPVLQLQEPVVPQVEHDMLRVPLFESGSRSDIPYFDLSHPGLVFIMFCDPISSIVW